MRVSLICNAFRDGTCSKSRHTVTPLTVMSSQGCYMRRSAAAGVVGRLDVGVFQLPWSATQTARSSVDAQHGVNGPSPTMFTATESRSCPSSQ